MSWAADYLPEAVKDLRELDGSQRLLARRAIQKMSQNPLPRAEGGLGIPLGGKAGNSRTGFLEIKLLRAGLRIVYKLVKINDWMRIVVIGAGADEEVYDLAAARAKKHDLYS